MMGLSRNLRRIRTLATAGFLVLVAIGSAHAGARRCPGDGDCDGIGNREERALGTNRWRADSDGDGLTDVFEARRLGTSPLVADSDGDGAGDGDEVCDGTDPNDGGKHRKGDRRPRIAGPVDAVDATALTITLFGCLAVDVSGAELDGPAALGDVTPGTFVDVKLDPTKLPLLVATWVRAEVETEGDGDDDCPEDEEGGEPGDGETE